MTTLFILYFIKLGSKVHHLRSGESCIYDINPTRNCVTQFESDQILLMILITERQTDESWIFYMQIPEQGSLLINKWEASRRIFCIKNKIKQRQARKKTEELREKEIINSSMKIEHLSFEEMQAKSATEIKKNWICSQPYAAIKVLFPKTIY